VSSAVSDPRRRSLGRGLSALLGPDEGEDLHHEIGKPTHLPIGALRPGRFQPRRRFDAEEMDALVRSVRAQGILQPILARSVPGEPGSYEIVAGERRWRAAQAVPLHEVPVIIRELDDGQALELALVENLQRQNLGPLEEAEGYRRLMREFDHTQEDLARVVGKSRSHIANMMRLLDLPQPVKTMLDEGALSAGHARALLGAADPAALAREAVRLRLNVRQTERLVAKGGRQARHRAGDADGSALAQQLSVELGYRVEILDRGDKGRMILHYTSLDQLDLMIVRLRGLART